MKILGDGKQVSARTYYYLLDYMDRNWDTKPLRQLCGKQRLCDTTLSEYIAFFSVATTEDLNDLLGKQ